MDFASPIPEKADFFVSYTAVDEDIAEWVAYCLEEAGYRVIFQKWDFRPGYRFPQLMNEATKRANRLVAILSNEYMEKRFPSTEWDTYFTKDPIGGLLVPVRVKPCSIDGLLSPIIHIDLVKFRSPEGFDEDKARLALLEGVRQGRAKPDRRPPFPPLPEGFTGPKGTRCI